MTESRAVVRLAVDLPPTLATTFQAAVRAAGITQRQAISEALVAWIERQGGQSTGTTIGEGRS